MLDALLSDLVRQKYPKQAMEVVVVEETDTPRPLKGVRYIPIPIRNLGFAHARNVAWRHATHDIVVYIDDDCRVSSDWLQKLLTPFTDLSVLGIQGGVTVPDSTNAIGWAESLLGFPGGGIKRVCQANEEIQETKEISTLNCAYRSRVIAEVGGFDEQLKYGGEDYLLAKQICNQGDCFFVPDALVSHKTRSNLFKIWHWFVRRGRAEIALIRTGKQQDTTFSTVLKSSVAIKLCPLFLTGLVSLKWMFSVLLLAALAYAFYQYVRYFRVWNASGASFMALAILPLVKISMDAAMDWGRLLGIAFD
jgi:GT2 family glycosyltransferase